MEDAMRAAILHAAMIVTALTAGGMGAAAQADGISDGTVRIGVLTDMAGVFSDLGGAGAVSAAHQNKPDIATGIARQWYDTGGVDLITDVINSGVALAVSSVAESKSRMLIVTGSGSTRLTNEQCSPFTISYTWDTPIPSPTGRRVS